MVLLAIASVSTNSPSNIFKDSILKFGENGEDLKTLPYFLLTSLYKALPENF